MSSKIFVKGFIFLALAMGLMVGLTSTSAFAAAYQTDTWALATDLDTEIINGRPGDINTTADSNPGFLYVGYTKTNGTRTSASAAGTQDTYYRSDTVLGVPTAEITAELATDGDSVYRQLGWPNMVEGFKGKSGHGTGDTLPHQIPETGETLPLFDSVTVLVIEKGETGTLEVHILNTSNYACTMLMVVHIPDSDFNAGFRGQGYAEEPQGSFSKFRITLAADSVANAGNFDSLPSAVGSYPFETMARISAVKLAEEAETFFYIRVASNATGFARDSLPITVVLFPDSANFSTTRYRRILHDTGYYGDNDTHYGRGGSEDSISLFAYVATAIVRATKKDSVFAPLSYRLVVENGADTVARAKDTVPGAVIVYQIIYDNDGNRRADSLTFIDFLDSNVDFYLDTIPATNTDDTVFSTNSVDTRMAHGRWMGGNADTGIIVEFSSRSALGTFIQETTFTRTAADGVLDTVGAIRIRWSSGGSKLGNLNRDQIDDGTYSGNAIDPLDLVDSCNIIVGAGSDSGDCGKIRFAVVIR